MPKHTINYNKSVIYKIEHEDKPDLLYVGSTTDFTRRKNRHKFNCNNNLSKEYNIKLYTMIRCNGGWDSFKIMIIKELNCNNKVEMLIEEDKMMKELKSTLNTKRAHRTKEQYKVEQAEYRNQHKEEMKQYDQQRNSVKHICECGSHYVMSNKHQHLRTKKHINFIATVEISNT